MFNCTSILFHNLAATQQQIATGDLRINTYVAKQLASQLDTAANETALLSGSDILIAYELVLQLLTYENSQMGLNLTHTQDRNYIQV